METKIAIFISGPIRFVDLVRKNLEQRFEGVAHDFFYHLWMQDLGNKVRVGYQSDPVALLGLPTTKSVIFHQPYSASFFEKTIGTQVNTHSSVNAVVGMYLALTQLCNAFSALPDRSEYTHILRIRTDCAVTENEFLARLDFSPNTVTLSFDSGLPTDGWVSDHLLFAPADLFLLIYQQSEIEDIYRAFEAAQRNPEKMLKHLLDVRLPKGTRLNPSIRRYLHYQIVYSPVRPKDQAWVRALVESGKVTEVFIEFNTHRRREEDLRTLDEHAASSPRRDPYGNSWLNRLRNWKKFFIN